MIVPEEVIGLPPTDNPPPFVIATLVTVPTGSSPEGTITHSDSFEIKVSPILHIGAVE